MSKTTITYFGILRSITSWAKVCRELVAALLCLGVDINVYERKGFLYDSGFPLDDTIKTKISNQFKGNIVFTFENPRIYRYLPRQSFNIGFLVYEFTCLPELWVEHIERYLDWVVVPSEFCRRVFIESGVSAKKVRVLRHGFNPVYYYPARSEKPLEQDFIFLCVANPHKREGIDLLLKSFSGAFSDKENARLIVKLSYIPKGRIKSFEYGSLCGLLRECIGRSIHPRIKFMGSVLSENEMGDLYRNAHCYVSLSRAEGFGMCLLEALACGLPVITPAWGGQVDFLNDRNAYFIQHTIVPARQEEYEKTQRPNFLALPDTVRAGEIMRDVYKTRRQVLSKKYPLSPGPRYFWWETVAREFIDWLKDV